MCLSQLVASTRCFDFVTATTVFVAIRSIGIVIFFCFWSQVIIFIFFIFYFVVVTVASNPGHFVRVCVRVFSASDFGGDLRSSGFEQPGCYPAHAVLLLLDEAGEGHEGRSCAIRWRYCTRRAR